MTSITAMASSFKSELLSGAHCFNAPVTFTASLPNASTVTTAISSLAGIAVGMAVTGTGIAGNTVVAATNATTLTLSIPTTAAISSGSLTATGDTFKICLIKPSPSGTYDSTLTNYGTGSGTPSTNNVGTDEITGTNYTAGGVTLTDVSPVLSNSTAYITFGSNPTWTGASFSFASAVVYNASSRLAGVSGRVIAAFDMGGTQTVTNGTCSLTLPASTASTSLIRIT